MENVARDNSKIEYKLYKRRWFMIFLFTLYNFVSSVRWAQYTAINKLVVEYYNASNTEVEWTSNIFTLFYVILVIPSLFLRTKWLSSIKYTIIISCFGIVISDWLQLYAVHPDRFLLAMIGQGLASASIMLTVGITGPFTAIWCGAKEISTAGVVTILGDQLGMTFSFFLPPLIVKEESIEIIGIGLWNIHLITSILSTITLFLLIIFLQEEPEKPPSLAQANVKLLKKNGLIEDLISILKNRAFWLLIVSYGLCVGSYGSILILLNQIILTNFTGEENNTHVGNIGAVMMISGMISSLIIGKILDKTRLFKESAVILAFCACVSILVFTWSLKSDNITFVYISGALIGFVILGYYATGIQIGLEVTYPISAQITVALMFLGCQFFALFSSIAYGYAVKIYGDLISNIGIFVLDIISMLAVASIPSRMKRQEVEKVMKTENFKMSS